MSRKLRKRLQSGIAAYSHEQAVLLRLLRRKKRLTEHEFDRIFNRAAGFSAPLTRRFPMTDDSFILGAGDERDWAKWLELAQIMMALGMIAAKEENGMVVYGAVEESQ